ncbi:hypothetical protein CO172_03335 [Candidatus Uhrbacteria bacterium CG_4_9_14_3_um_filter_36_7]|uniref:Amino acid transporter transmembrane domain-containing protein n=1 Tax=Candidatus Uhrbacteria bacterium CG_4_9_14_3_um_filter_36_7 TaxID=1975033 RepID=A0A2M7XGE1_9BACT|nr:MAG: hypothetical protein CO172_03335 [Candidatus Uhrbacteria bacterium CG_4_9_14_3_um_filter_36_7]
MYTLRTRFSHPNWLWFRALSAVIGSVIGVGVFGLPYAFAKSGFVLGTIELVIFGIFLVALPLMFSEVVIQTQKKHRLAGYVSEYMGTHWGHVSMLALTASSWGAMIAYIIVGGRFLFTLFHPFLGGEEIFYQIAMPVLALLLTLRGISFLSKIEVYLVGGLLFLFLFLTLSSLPYIKISHLVQIDTEHFFVPYGVILFAFSGLGIIPEIKAFLGEKQKHLLSHAILVGYGLIFLLYFAFTFAVVGLTGPQTTEIAFDGVIQVLGPFVGVIGSLLGTLTILSIFSLMAMQLQDSLSIDYKVPRSIAWLGSILIPLALFLFGVRTFIDLIGFVGSVFGGIIAILVILTYQKMRHSGVCRRHHCLNVPKIITIIIAILFLIGMSFEIYQVLL